MADSPLDQLAETHGHPIPDDQIGFRLFENAFLHTPDKLALISAFQPADHLAEVFDDAHRPTDHVAENGGVSCLSWTYGQIHYLAMRLAAGLLANGVQPGDTVATFIANRAECCLFIYLSYILRVSFAPLDPGALLPPRRAELENFLSVLRPVVVIVPDEEAGNAVDAAQESAGVPPATVRLYLDMHSDMRTTTHWKPFSTFLREANQDDLPSPSILLDLARNDSQSRIHFIHFTSGTSSNHPKGCPKSLLVSSSIVTSRYARSGCTVSRLLLLTANFRAVFGALVPWTWKEGATIVLPSPAFEDAGLVMDLIEKLQITTSGTLPPMIHAFASHPQFDAQRFKRVKDVFVGGDMVTKDLLLKAQKVFPEAHITAAHGMTEGGGLFEWCFPLTTPVSELPYYANTVAPVGQASPIATLRIWNLDRQTVARRGEAGELQVRCGHVIDHYLHNEYPENFLTDPQTGERWLRTGDLVVMSREGWFYILGRIKSIIMRGGIPITPAALENSISSFTGLPTAVIPLPSPTLGEEPVAVLEAFPTGVDAEAVKRHVLEVFGEDYALGAVVTLEELGLRSWPLNATGKVMKLELAEAVKGLLAKEKEDK